MSDPNQPKPTWRDKVEDGGHKLTSKVKDGWHKLTLTRGNAAQNTSDTAQSKPDPDWQAWKIDDNTIAELRVWGDNHGKSNWRKLADRIDASLETETFKAVEDFIPDSPVPARTLVKALLSIIKLGIHVPVIQKKVYDFAQEAIEYICIFVEVIGAEPTAKEDLETICTAVNEICKWASEHVTALSANELGDWRSKFAKAKEMFLATNVLQIKVAQAQEQRQVFIKDKLANHVATKPEYTDQSKNLCADHTRVDIQAEITRWLAPQLSNRERIFWITGIAGSGKSTLSATVVDTLRKMGTPVAAQFFISRNIPETIDPNKLIPTIAKQLAEFSPAAAQVIHNTLKNGFPSSREEQVKTLLLAPIRKLCKSCDVVIILIDALDELLNAAESVRELLSPIAPRGCDLPDNIRFLITSRPEHWADISRSETLDLAVFKQDTLATELSVKEVNNFIAARMQKITPKELGWDGWPTDDQLLKLSEKADGLFHYAATALHWIEGRIRKSGTASRNSVFEKFTDLGIGQLENLYKLILTSFEDIDETAEDPQLRMNQLHGFHHVIGTILVLENPLTIHQITALLADIPEDDFDVTNFLQQFRSVLIPGMTASFEEATPQMHKSFRDYIMNDHAPAAFRVLTGHAHFVTARSCLEVIVVAGSQSGIHRTYSVQHWHRHLRRAMEQDVTLEDERMWKLLGQMVEKAAHTWVGDLMDLFVNVVAVAWKLLQQDTKKDRITRLSTILMKSKEKGLGLGELFEGFKEFRRAEEEEVHTFSPLPVLVSLIYSHLLDTREFLIKLSGIMAFFRHGSATNPTLLKTLLVVPTHSVLGYKIYEVEYGLEGIP